MAAINSALGVGLLVDGSSARRVFQLSQCGRRGDAGANHGAARLVNLRAVLAKSRLFVEFTN